MKILKKKDLYKKPLKSKLNDGYKNCKYKGCLCDDSNHHIIHLIRHHYAFLSGEFAEIVKKSKTKKEAYRNVFREGVYWEDKKTPAEDEYIKEILWVVNQAVKQQKAKHKEIKEQKK